MQKYDAVENEQKVIELIKDSKMAVSTDFIAYHLDISWITSRALLLNMTVKGLILMEKTTKSMIFRLPKKDKPVCDDCKSWAGRCMKSQALNKLASSPACDIFEHKNSVEVQQ